MKTKLNGPEKLVCNIYNKKNHVVHIRALRQALNHGLMMKKVHNVLEFNQEALFWKNDWKCKKAKRY